MLNLAMRSGAVVVSIALGRERRSPVSFRFGRERKASTSSRERRFLFFFFLSLFLFFYIRNDDQQIHFQFTTNEGQRRHPKVRAATDGEILRVFSGVSLRFSLSHSLGHHLIRLYTVVQCRSPRQTDKKSLM